MNTFTQISDLTITIACDECGEYLDYTYKTGTKITDEIIENDFYGSHECYKENNKMRKIEKLIIETRGSDDFETMKEMYENWSGDIYELKHLKYKDLLPCLSEKNYDETQLIKVRDKYYMGYSSLME